MAKLPYPDLAEGWYVVGTGNTGVAAGLATMGAAYFAAMFASSLMIKRPPAGYLPGGDERVFFSKMVNVLEVSLYA